MQQQPASFARRASSGISWAAQLQLQEPDDPDEEDVQHKQWHQSRPVQYHQPQQGHQSQARQTSSVAAQAASLQIQDQFMGAHMQALELHREGLNAYYRDKAAAEPATAPSALSTPEVTDQTSEAEEQPLPTPQAGGQAEVEELGSLHQHGQRSSIGDAVEVRGIVNSAAEEASGVVGISVLERLRGVKAMANALTTVPSYDVASLQQEMLSPGLPGLQSQLSKMMQEISQTRNQVHDLQSELYQSTLQSQKSGNISLGNCHAA